MHSDTEGELTGPPNEEFRPHVERGDAADRSGGRRRATPREP
ncbi:MAG: hypothetical protein U5K37_07745 [Natrialbaceae archaeon]|nr:hypothetical protein [Natrialbaceae archaeon]